MAAEGQGTRLSTLGNGRHGTLGGALVSLVAAGLGMATAFGIALSVQEQSSILTFTGAVIVAAPLVGAVFDHSRAQVTARAEAAHEIAHNVDPTTDDRAAEIEAEIARLQAQKEALGGH